MPAVGAVVLLAATLCGCAGGSRLEFIAAHVAVELNGAGVARDGIVELAPQEQFQVHAVLEAKRRNGETVYFTEAAGLQLQGRTIDAAEILPWEGSDFVQVLWLTLEAPRRYAEVSNPQQLESFSFDGFARPDWGRGWVAEAQLGLRSEETLDVHAGSEVAFGTRFLQAWIELSAKRNAILPDQRIKSPGPEALMADPRSITTLVVREGGALGVAQHVFGLSQLEPKPGVTEQREEIQSALFDLQQRGLAYSRLGLLREMLDTVGVAFEDLGWDLVELGAESSWGDAVNAGDLLRVGNRWVVLLADRGQAGVLDGDDLCIDVDKGATVLELSEVFVGEGEIEHAALAG